MWVIEICHLFIEKVPLKSIYPLLTPLSPKLFAMACPKLLVYNSKLTHTSTEEKGLPLLFFYMSLLLKYQHSWLEGEDTVFLKQHLILGYIVTVSGARSQQCFNK